MSQPTQTTIRPEEIISIILKRRWFIIVPFCLAMIVGSYLAVTLPKSYEATTTVAVQSQKVPDEIVQSVVSSDISARLSTITQQVMSSTNIERIIEEFGLFSGPQYDDMFLEDKVASIRKNVTIDTNIDRRGDGSSTFSISYEGNDPQKVKKIVDALATYYIDENLKVRQNQATSTSDFLDDELETMRQRLENSEKTYGEYRQKYMGELPDQLNANLSILERLSEELIDRQAALRETSTAIAALEQQIVDNQRIAQQTVATGTGENDESADLGQLQAQLKSLQSRYTENHPSVVRLKGIIAKLEEQQGSEITSEDISGTTNSIYGNDSAATPQQNQLASLKLQAQNMEIEISELKKQIELYQKRVENTPKREEELLSIQRDYNNLQSQYESLRDRQLETELSVNMEKKQQGEQFQIIDAARVPQRPVSPDMDKLLLMTIAAGLGLGGGIVFLLEFTKKTFKRIADVESTLGLPVLASVPAILNKKDRILRMTNNIFSIGAVTASVLLLGGFALITQKGTDTTLELIKKLTNL